MWLFMLALLVGAVVFGYLLASHTYRLEHPDPDTIPEYKRKRIDPDFPNG